ncbi:MAG: DsbA family protein [Rhodovarius sp.]|nr:DsbA family protein [Rhodovarius sp.]MDW8314331.1 DsbA family protein [Rhodovarius sp.]
MIRRRLLPALAAAAALPAAAQGLTEAQRAEVLELLRRALREDPSLLREGLAALQAAEEAERAEAQRRAIRDHAAALFRDPTDPFKGNAAGRIVLVEFFDARCGFCKAFHPTMEELLRRRRELRVVLKDLPILGPPSLLAARALLAAHRQERYLPLYDGLMRLREEVTETTLRREAERAGIDWARLRRDMADPAIARRIEENLALARAIGVQGTPALVVGEQLLSGAVDLATLERAVAALAG